MFDNWVVINKRNLTCTNTHQARVVVVVVVVEIVHFENIIGMLQIDIMHTCVCV